MNGFVAVCMEINLLLLLLLLLILFSDLCKVYTPETNHVSGVCSVVAVL